MQKRALLGKGGFTLIEIVLTLAISATLVVTSATCLKLIFETETRIGGERELREQGEQLLGYITHEIRNADVLVAPVAGATGQSTSFIPFGQFEATNISLHDGRLWQSTGGDPETPLSNSRAVIEDFAVANLAEGDGAGSLGITLSLTSLPHPDSLNLGTSTLVLHTSATLRSQKQP